MTAVFEPKPRWAGAPPTCVATGLGSFTTEALAKECNSGPQRENPNFEPYRITRIWVCDFCNHWHYTIKMRPPSGSSSGSSRR